MTSLLLKDDPTNEAKVVDVLVFGDSWGAMGPSWHMLENMFTDHHVHANVKSTAVSGTTACQWALFPGNLAVAAGTQFPIKGPDFVWFTLGGNDLLSEDYLKCSKAAKTHHRAIKCAIDSAAEARNCNLKLLKGLFDVFPKTKVVQCGYDFQCSAGSCLPFQRWPFCQYNTSCADYMGRAWANELLRPLNKIFADDSYTSVAIDGSCQEAGHIPHGHVGSPNMHRGSPCELMLGCEHPAPFSLAAYTIGEVFWEKFFKNYLRKRGDPLDVRDVPIFKPVPGWQYQKDSLVEDVACNSKWVPNLADTSSPPPPCNNTFEGLHLSY